MKKFAEDLIFISRIKRDGSGVETNFNKPTSTRKDGWFGQFELICLSISEKTYIAHGFNAYVVKLKNP